MEAMVCFVNGKSVAFDVLDIRNQLTLCDRDVFGFLNKEKVVESLDRGCSCRRDCGSSFHSSV